MTWILLSILISEQIYAQQGSEKKEYQKEPKDHIDWNINNELSSRINPDLKSLGKKGYNFLYSYSNHYHLLYETTNLEKYKYDSMPHTDKIISITLYYNMSDIGNTRVYQNMSDIGNTRVYQNMSDIGNTRVYQNMSDIG
ncbi:MAG: hypothetical protein ACE5SW_12395, partial [Nitrososphaeraceae archaeon]